MKRHVHISALSTDQLTGLLLLWAALKKKPGYPRSVDPRGNSLSNSTMIPGYTGVRVPTTGKLFIFTCVRFDTVKTLITVARGVNAQPRAICQRTPSITSILGSQAEHSTRLLGWKSIEEANPASCFFKPFYYPSLRRIWSEPLEPNCQPFTSPSFRPSSVR